MNVGNLVLSGMLGLSIVATATTAPLSATKTPNSHQTDLTSDRGFTNRANHDGAVVVKGFPCGVPVPGAAPLTTVRSHSVITPSGNAATSCHARTPLTLTQAVVVRDAPCATSGGAGTDSHLVATPSGHLNFWCHRHR